MAAAALPALTPRQTAAAAAATMNLDGTLVTSRSLAGSMRHRGRVVKATGDGFLATFEGPARSINCARSLTAATAGIGVEIRAGLHAGECELIGDDIGGMCVHLAARVCRLAGPGEVLVSRTVKDLVVGSGIEFSAQGAHELKGVPGKWELFSVA